MASHANQQYYADGEYIDKQAREFQPTMAFKAKVDSIEEWAQVNVIEDVKVNWTSLPVEDKAVDISVPLVIDNLYTVDWSNALSAKQGKVLYDLVQNLQSRGRYLSNWNTATWLPVTNPEASPYPYKVGDYYIVSNVAAEGATNYRPNWSEFIVWQASSTVETSVVKVTDIYLYDGTNWNLLINSTREIPIDSALSTSSTNPVENRVVTNAINSKQDKLIAWTNIQIANDWKTISATDTTYTAWANINIDANNEISATDTTYTAWANVQISNENVISATDTTYSAWDNIAITNNTISATYTAWTGIDITNWVITNTQTSAEWWNITWTLSDQTDLQSALNNKQDKFHTTSSSQPSNPSEWDEWYDSTNDVLKVYDGSQWNEVGAWTWDMLYADFNWVTKTWATVTLDLNSEITPSANFTVNAPSTIKDWQIYVLRVTNWVTAYTMTLGTGITNPQSVDTTLTANWVDQFVFLAVDWNLELQPTAEAIEQCNTKTFYLSSTSDLTNAQAAYNWYLAGKNPIIVYDNLAYSIDNLSPSALIFTGNYRTESYNSSYSAIYSPAIQLNLSWDTVTSVTLNSQYERFGVLTTNADYSAPYTPRYNWSPATKKYVDDRDTYIWTSAPSNPVEWRLWYDTTNDVLKVYDGTNWNATGKTYTAWTNISIDANNVISATDTTYTAWDWIDITNNEISVDTDVIQEKLTAWTGISITWWTICTTESDRKGPAPSGFHVPSKDEWQWLITIMNWLGLTTVDNWRINLHMPLTGYRNRATLALGNQGTRGYYWLSTPDRASSDSAYYMNLPSSWEAGVNSNFYCYGYPVRSFKNSYVTPDSSWTVISWTLWSAWIFWNQSEWLISITDWTTGYTMQDKNLWATTVYSDWDTLTQANMWSMYQWGNNYWFPSTWTISKSSSTRVDTTGYWPTNPYSSDTFIKGQTWSTVGIYNLWWDTSNGTHEECVGDPLVISADTTVLATKSDIANLWNFEVVDTLPSTATADTKTIYLLWPIWTWADKYEEWIITNQTIKEKVTLSSSSSSATISDTITITASDISITRASWFIIAYSINVYQNWNVLFWYSYWHWVPSWLLDANWDPVDSVTIPAWTISASDFSTITSISIKVGEHTEKTWTKIWETSIDLSGYALDSNVNTKTFTLSSASDLDTIRNAIAWKNAWKNPIIAYNWYYYETGSYSSWSSWTLYATKVDTSVSWASQNKMVIGYDMWSPVSITILSDAISSWATWDMLYADFNWVTKTWATITLDLNSTITPSANFTVNAPSTIKDWQIYILRVETWATAYTMTLGTNVINPYSEDLTLTANTIAQFSFLGIDGNLELQPIVKWWSWWDDWMKLAPNSPLSPKHQWFWTEAQYKALSQYYTDEANDTVYYTI